MTNLKITNVADVEHVAQGVRSPDQVRSVTIEALVDTGATMLVLPAEVVAAVGLRHKSTTRKAKMADGSIVAVPWVTGVLIEILGREMSCDALVMPAGSTALIGQIPLEGLDLVVDAKSRGVHVNPASPDSPLLDLLRAS